MALNKSKAHYNEKKFISCFICCIVAVKHMNKVRHPHQLDIVLLRSREFFWY